MGARTRGAYEETGHQRPERVMKKQNPPMAKRHKSSIPKNSALSSELLAIPRGLKGSGDRKKNRSFLKTLAFFVVAYSDSHVYN
jgi:hypothetical protein